MSNQAESETDQQSDITEIRLAWGSTKELQTVYVNQVLITTSQNEFYLTFGELIPPAVGVEDIPEIIEIAPKIRLAISPLAMKAIAGVMQESVQRFTSRGQQSDANNSTE